eukprot:TRINITY_DN11966_c0_g1_i2.p1 TRINITY_DN11966_c0_g1~~TRINITY_DN11966_c0_g1_i2.p1  ORF type:complete len:681 (+),score=158.79 TRINITY_DN11966_c0_g1_i2:249-2291(+)
MALSSFTYDVVETLLTLALFVIGWHIVRSVKAMYQPSPTTKRCKMVDQETEIKLEPQDDLTPKPAVQTENGAKTLPLPAASNREETPQTGNLKDSSPFSDRSCSDDLSPPGSSFSDEWPDIWSLEADRSPSCFGNADGDRDMFAWLQDSDDAEDTWGMRRGPSPQTAVASDVSRALEVALSSGDATLADSVLSSGARLCDAGWLKKALHRMKAANIPVSAERTVELIQVYAREQRADLAAALWRERCSDHGDNALVAEPQVYAALLEACAVCGDFETAAKAAESVAWAAPQSVSGQQAMLALARWLARRQGVGPAMQCYAAVRDARDGAVDLPTHRTVLKTCVGSNDMMRADILFQELVSSDITPDYAIFSAMIRGHRAAGRPQEAMSHFAMMRRKGIQPTASIFDVVLECCFWQDVPALVEQVLTEMESAGIQPSSGTLAAVLKLYGQSCKIDKALEAFEEIPRRCGLKVDSRAYSAMISACLEGSRLDLALDTLDRMTAAGFAANARTYERLIKACLHEGWADRAVELVEEAFNLEELDDESSAASEVETASEGESAEEQQTGEGLRVGWAALTTAAAASEPETPPRAMRPPTPRARLESDCIQEVLRFLGRRNEAARLGVGLLRRLTKASIEVPEALQAALKKAAGEQVRRTSWVDARRGVHRTWRHCQQQVEVDVA